MAQDFKSMDRQDLQDKLDSLNAQLDMAYGNDDLSDDLYDDVQAIKAELRSRDASSYDYDDRD